MFTKNQIKKIEKLNKVKENKLVSEFVEKEKINIVANELLNKKAL